MNTKSVSSNIRKWRIPPTVHPSTRATLPQVFPASQAWRSSMNGRGDLWVMYQRLSMLNREVFGLRNYMQKGSRSEPKFQPTPSGTRPRIRKRLELDGVPVRVLDEHAALFAHFALHHQRGSMKKAYAHLLATCRAASSSRPCSSTMPQWSLGTLALRVVDPRGLDQLGHLLDGELVSEEVVVHPGVGAAALRGSLGTCRRRP